MSRDAHLPLVLDGPMQSWGSASRFQRRTTGLYPTKSGVIGLVCAAMGLAKGTPEEHEKLQRLAALRMHTVFLPRPKAGIRDPKPARRSDWIEPRRMEDYHTVGGGFDPKTQPDSVPRTASGKPDKDVTISRREYLYDARFGVILVGEKNLLNDVADALQNPVWGTWLGRKSCIAAAPVWAGNPFESCEAAWTALLTFLRKQTHAEAVGSTDEIPCLPAEIPYAAFGSIEEVLNSDEPHTTVMDQPVSFGDGTSSGPDKRQFTVRRICLKPGVQS